MKQLSPTQTKKSGSDIDILTEDIISFTDIRDVDVIIDHM